jgi:alkaline phosphatase D
MDDREAAQSSGPPRFRFPDGELRSAAMLGDVTDRSVRVWVRDPGGSAQASLVVGGEEVASQDVGIDAAHDSIGVAVLSPSEPRPGAPFEVRVGERTLSHRFAPLEGAPAGFSFAFGSCHQPFDPAANDGSLHLQPAARIYPLIHRLLAARGAAFALWLGDQVYSDGVSELSVRERMAQDRSITDEQLLDTYRHLYRGYFNETGYRRLAEALPAYLMWDDHDIFDGYGSLLDQSEFDGRIYRAARAAYVEYQHARNPEGALDARSPFGYSFWHGDVGFHVPDLRGERDFHAGRVLGDAGWAKLDRFLAEASERGVPTIFIGLSVPLVHASPAIMSALERVKAGFGRDVRDRWSVPAFAAQRTMLLERLFGWQSERRRRQVIVLSGDVHVGAAFNVRALRSAGHFSQWTSSALSTPVGPKHAMANRVITTAVRLGERELRVWRRGLATRNNVGLVTVAPADGGGHEVVLEIHELRPEGERLAVALRDAALPR